MSDSERTPVSLVAADVLPGQEEEFLGIITELHRLVRERGYGQTVLLQDAAHLRLYYDFRSWSNAGAPDRCHADPEVQSLTRKLQATMKPHQLIGVAWPVAATVVGMVPGPPKLERRAGSDRRAGYERRSGRDAGGRIIHYAGPERRLAERRVRDRRARTQPARSGAELVQIARTARSMAHAPFSDFRVGAALETMDGVVLTGSNVENATYSLTLCAERVALAKALSEGHRRFRQIAIVAETNRPITPCGACRQILWEFGGDLDVVVGNMTEELGRWKLSQLFPHPFDVSMLGGDQVS